MEMIIMVSVLSTLGVVALFTSIVVMFRRLKSKVDVVTYEKETNDIYKSTDMKKFSIEQYIYFVVLILI